jgi:general secretion pathway protein D
VTEGLVLTVTPQIAEDGIIQMSVSPSVTERTGETMSAQGDAVPVLSVREMDTLVRVHSGQTAVVTGLLQATGDQKTDLVVLLTPVLVAPTRAAALGG